MVEKGPRDAPPAEDVSDEAIWLAWAELDEKRREMDLRGDRAAASDFPTKLLGGAWTRMHKGKAYDAVIGIARGGLARRWCAKYKLNMEASFSIARYSEEKAHSLAMEWSRRMQFFFDLYTESGDSEHVYSQGELDGYEEDIPWIDFLLAEDVDSPTWERAQIIRAMVPSKHPVKK